ncbi:unnamed protein product [Kuraishia capsulata CBS 1993]|uniref:Cytochrome c oxidase assembly protein COX20, mitochondrial n=1 Tax=Kuraishia capsulata CBS 1993 TaxID=1382522 RepID=W6MR44_9ASCO|nr:uncharacterized protein KUCA_T00000295001 [Kuraishia capsulata CBS 1993]CDK24335.1 unnamed protein product [Kuraishia capsulata CBS 1993]
METRKDDYSASLFVNFPPNSKSMAWYWPSGKSKDSEGKSPAAAEPVKTASKQQYLDELPPKFSETTTPKPQLEKPTKADLSQAWKTISWDDFKLTNLVQIPCFRDAGLTGLATMGVFGSVIFIFYKNPSKAINWSFGGLWIGSIVGWEQCNSLRRTSNKTTQIAKQVYEQKSRKED